MNALYVAWNGFAIGAGIAMWWFAKTNQRRFPVTAALVIGTAVLWFCGGLLIGHGLGNFVFWAWPS